MKYASRLIKSASNEVAKTGTVIFLYICEKM